MLKLVRRLFPSDRLGAAVALIVAAEFVLVVVFWDELGGRSETNSATLRNVGLLAAAPVALAMALSRTTSARRAADTNQQRLLNERFQSAAGMLGSGLLVSRLSGVHALTNLAREDPEGFHVPAMSLLCALVRTSPASVEDQPTTARPRLRNSDVPEDVRAAIAAIAYRFTDGRPRVQGAGSPEAPNEAQKRLAVLEGLSGFVPDLSGANISWIRLRGANLANALLTGANADHADLSDSNLDRIEFDHGSAYGTILNNSSLVSANFAYTDMSHVRASDADFAHATLGSSLFSSQLRAADLYASRLIGTNMSQADISCANLSSAYLEQAQKYLFATNDEDFRFLNITQQQLDSAIAAPGFEPHVDPRIKDPATDAPIAWRRSNPDCSIYAEFDGPRMRRFSTSRQSPGSIVFDRLDRIIPRRRRDDASCTERIER